MITINSKYDIIKRIFSTQLSKRIQTVVKGDSMIPEMLPNDQVILEQCQLYDIGEIIVYHYLDEGILVHRILDYQNGLYYCKGDNAFRVEKVPPNTIIGKVINLIRNNQIIELQKKDLNFINLSYQINKLLIENNGNREMVTESSLYKEYYSKYIKKDYSII